MMPRHTKAKNVASAIRPERKERVTITLSRDSVEYVRAISAKERSHVSTVMERLIESARRAEELKQLNSGISAYYDALPDAGLAEDAAWGQLGAAGLAAFVESEGDETISDAAPEVGAR
jgi:hypothetical protein